MTTHENGSGSDRVHALVSQREQLRGWIAKLDEVQTGAPSRVAERVRADYHDRLRRVTEELSEHGEEIQRNLQALRDQLAAAEERRTQAADALEETRLRHLIGELDEAAWDQARAPLEQDVAAAEQAAAATRTEVEHLSTLATDIAGAADSASEAEEDEPAADEAPAAVADGEGDEADDEDAGDDLPFFGADDDDAAAASADADDESTGWEPELELASSPEATPSPADARAASDDAGVSGAELAAWISEVEAEGTGAAPAGEDAVESEPVAGAADRTAPTADDVDGWDPFANEFGGSPANPTTQPGDAAQDLPWLDSLQGGAAGKWSQPSESEGDDLAFLDNLDTPAPAADAQPAADLAADDLAFLEELDRAISGGAQRPPASAAPAAGQGSGLGAEFQGGSGGGLVGGSGESTQEQPRKRGQALLCKECGAINEPQAWYCEICGSEL
ncbi:MAG TPA: hypothetical protein VFJ16_25555 [Longimicrobium sp.]|nr:hypothetical protein [Longimicrobium sp.]